MEVAEKMEVLELIYQEATHPRKLRPVALTKETECFFFRSYDNRFDGYFVDVQYADGLYEIWFVVDVRGGLADYDWYVQKIR